MTSPSASPDPLIGVDPGDTIEVQYGGATFVIGVLPAGDFDVMDARIQVARQQATRRVIKSLHEQGVDPEAEAIRLKDGVLSEADLAVSMDPTFIQESAAVYYDAVRLAVKGHSGFVNRKGEPFPFKQTDDKREVHKDVMDVYGRNGKLLRALWFHIRALNDMGVLSKKA